MANIDKGFNVEIISLGDKTLITSGELDPRVSGYEAPTGSLFAYKNGTSSALLIKNGPLDTNWVGIFNALPAGGMPGEYLVKNTAADYDLVYTDRAHASVLKAYAKNDGLTTLVKGTPVFASGGISGRAVNVQAADASSPTTMPAIGVLGQDLAPQAEGELLILGEIIGVDTSAFAEGDLIYVAAGGGYTNVKPTDPNIEVQFLGIVTKSHPTSGGGVITGTGVPDHFRVNANTGKFEVWNGAQWVPIVSTSLLNELSDVTITTPTAGQVLSYDGTQWINSTAGSATTSHDALSGRELPNQHPISAITGLQAELDSKSDATHTHTLDWLSDVTILSPQAGEGLYYNGSTWINFGSQGGASGGGAAKRIWSNNIPAQIGTTVIIPGATVPLVTAGTQLWSLTLVPVNNTATYVIQTSVAASGGVNNSVLTLALFRNNIFIGGTTQTVNSSNNSATLTISVTDRPATTGTVVYQVRVGIDRNVWYVNRRIPEVTYGGLNNGWVVWEY